MHARGLLLLFTLVSSEWVFAQSDLEKIYYNDSDYVLKDASGCYYYSVSRKREYRRELDTLRTIFCLTEKERTIEVINRSGQRSGSFIQFDENENQIINGEFYQGKPIFIQQKYEDGKEKSIERYRDEEKFIDQYWDSLGNQVVKDGTGYCHCSLSDYYGGAAYQKGKVVKGLPDSVWTGYTKEHTLSYMETYNEGKLINGTSYDVDGNQFHYTVLSEMAQPIGGLEVFYQHVSRVLKYPKKAMKIGIQGKVYVEFIVEKDGSLSDVRVRKGIGGGCDEEAISSVLSAPKWKPGIQRGQKVKARYVVPITFKLG